VSCVEYGRRGLIRLNSGHNGRFRRYFATFSYVTAVILPAMAVKVF
jgi:hypothetical protein